jgi:hypothetical protein
MSDEVNTGWILTICANHKLGMDCFRSWTITLIPMLQGDLGRRIRTGKIVFLHPTLTLIA